MYNLQAESYAVLNSTKWEEIWEDLCHWGVSKPFRIRDLIGKCPSISSYAVKTQTDILRAHIKAHNKIHFPGDRIIKVGTGLYAWQIYKDDKPQPIPSMKELFSL